MGRYCIMIYEKRDMANEDKKDFNAMLNDSKDMPKFQVITDEKSIEKYGGDRIYFAPPIDYDRNICFDCCMGEFSAKK